MKAILQTVCGGRNLTREQSSEVFGRLIAGELSEIEISALIVALKTKGETPEEIAGAAQAMRQAATPFDTADLDVGDSCGTGGDESGTVNISTAVALLAAEAGLAIAKHGNRSVSSKCGSADVLQQCGVDIQASPAVSRRCLQEQRICFLFAPQYHAGVRHAMPVRRALGMRTIFNVLGPLANPANPRWQIMGVYDPALCEPMAHTLGMLGCESALVVHGSGLDEIALHGPTHAARLEAGKVRTLCVSPGEVGLEPRSLDELRGGDAAENARWLQALLGGKGRPAHNEAVALNTGALLWVSGRCADLAAGYRTALATLGQGGGAARLQRWAELSHAAT